MAVSVVMPALEMAQETGKLVSWRKKEGDRVAKGETLMEVETDKAVVEVEAQAEGILGGVTANTGDVVPVGQTIAWLLQPGEKPPAATAQAQTGRKMESSPRHRLPRQHRSHRLPLPQVRFKSHRKRGDSPKSMGWMSASSVVRAPAVRSSPKMCSQRRNQKARRLLRFPRSAKASVEPHRAKP